MALIAAAVTRKIGDTDEWTVIREPNSDHYGHLHLGKRCFGRVVGSDGMMGSRGERGEKGEAGPEGPQGSIGPQGEMGPAGPAAASGPIGPKGDTGDTGPMGPQGEVGPRGEKGEAGDAGPQGVRGETGLQGIQGLKGDKGDTGSQGAQGIQGNTGAAGPMGPAGTVALYDQSGLVSGTAKIWVGAANPNSSGIWTINYANAGFTRPPQVMVCSANLGSAPADRNFASVNTLSITNTGCNGGVSNAVTTGLLVATVLTNSPTTTPVLVMAIGV